MQLVHRRPQPQAHRVLRRPVNRERGADTGLEIGRGSHGFYLSILRRNSAKADVR